MAGRSIGSLTRRFLASILRPIHQQEQKPISIYSRISSNTLWAFRKSNLFRNYGSSSSSVRCVISADGKPKFETFEIDPPKKYKWLTKKRLKLQRKKEKKKRRGANKNDPRRLTVKGSKKKAKFANAEERIEYKLEKAKIKEALLVERLKRYEVSRLQGPMVKPVEITGEERFYMKKMAQKGSNYVPVGRRGVFGGVILNMHMHWKKHETVKVFCKPCKPGQIQEYANELARLSGGIPIQIIGDDTIIFYRGKEYVQPEVMSPIDTLSKKKALEKSKYEQSLETVRHFIAIAEKELELYHRHIALYGDPAQRNPNTISSGASEASEGTGEAKKALAIDNTNDKSLATEDDDEDEDEDNGDDDHHTSLFLSVSSTDDSSTELDSSDEDS
ncbi:RNA-binding CRS1 / YhbY (CRM) domain protein [Artemisia annua]|uniref:RNA-binding CRS1 / YhbY (CRM) domain protein n=1 Tax=Artemisia annua TaxID=35608 RepID=A0A2U1NZ44_ARTAN|nr:RNA-binding CRS1 / YhbY (CRM) domain protein [Artemisia annua]